ncbi:hypothetical protein Pcinc_013932 [Petrolisthes cinctipes]|uniref:Uncharacterized protein n=1 Tax=Petrolisthes cinctipes TaxID=88211 RepID=A0AAE1KS96_PETCI|nr:hypothetical protein Pcinc_013932 [Petrolisthes cinctipes]
MEVGQSLCYCQFYNFLNGVFNLADDASIPESSGINPTGTSSNGGMHWLLCLANPVITRLEEEEEEEEEAE